MGFDPVAVFIHVSTLTAVFALARSVLANVRAPGNWDIRLTLTVSGICAIGSLLSGSWWTASAFAPWSPVAQELATHRMELLAYAVGLLAFRQLCVVALKRLYGRWHERMRREIEASLRTGKPGAADTITPATAPQGEQTSR